jgi:hypothetical protein
MARLLLLRTLGWDWLGDANSRVAMGTSVPMLWAAFLVCAPRAQPQDSSPSHENVKRIRQVVDEVHALCPRLDSQAQKCSRPGYRARAVDRRPLRLVAEQEAWPAMDRRLDDLAVARIRAQQIAVGSLDEPERSFEEIARSHRVACACACGARHAVGDRCYAVGEGVGYINGPIAREANPVGPFTRAAGPVTSPEPEAMTA